MKSDDEQQQNDQQGSRRRCAPKPRPRKMAGLQLLPQAMLRSGATRTLTSSIRTLSLALAASATQIRRAVPAKQQQQIRSLSQAILPTRSHRCTNSCDCSRPTLATARSGPTGGLSGESKGFQGQQTRGMKVHSSIKKRCEHCKVGTRSLSLWGSQVSWADRFKFARASLIIVVLRSSVGKRTSGAMAISTSSVRRTPGINSVRAS